MIPHRRHQSSDDGAVLIIALIIITSIALVTGALLTKGSGNFLATLSLRQVAGTAYTGDAAAKIAINDLELGVDSNNLSASPDVRLPPGFLDPSGAHGPKTWVFDNNIDGTGCFGSKVDPTNPTASVPISSLTLPNVYPAVGDNPSATATVTCTPVPGTGIFGTAAGSNDDGTGRAITILGSSGLLVNPQGVGNTALFQVRGDIASAGPITVDHGKLYTSGSVIAHTCPASSAIDADGGPCTDSGGSVNDPFFDRSPDLTAVPTTLGTWSGCTFQPGYYDDAVALTAATDACKNQPAVFTPGTYYFDFHNNSSDPTYANGYAMAGTGNNVWSIKYTVIGGDTTGGTDDIPGRCRNPIDHDDNTGVQFVFGGDSRIALESQGNQYAHVELCAPHNAAGKPPIVIFGLDGTTGRGPLSAGYENGLKQTPTVTASSVTSSVSGNQADFKPNPASATDKDALASTGGAVEKWSANSGNNTPTLTLAGFSPSTTPPNGSLLASATLQVTHQESFTTGTGNPSITPHLKVTAGATTADFSSKLTNVSTVAGTPMTTDTIDLTQNANLIKALAAGVHKGDLTGLSASFYEDAHGKAAASVDAVKLMLTYYTPTLRGETTAAISTNCIANRTCDFIATGNGSSFKGAFVAQGVTYIPKGSINVSLGNQTAVVALRWGIVADHATLGSLNLFPFAYPVVSIPQLGPGFGADVTAVDLRVFLCTGAGPCSTSGSPVLTSRVKITDPINPDTGLVNPGPGTRKIDVLSWSEQR